MALIPLLLVVPLCTAALLAAFGRHFPRRLADVLALGAGLFELVDALWLLHASRAQPLVYWFGAWAPHGRVAIGIDFFVEPLGAGFAALSAGLTLAGLIFSIKYFDAIGAMFHALMLVFMAALCAFAVTGDLFDLFVFFELMGATGYALCGYKSEELGPIQGALNFAVSNTVGAFLTLMGIGLVYGRTGALNLSQLSLALGPAPERVVVGLVLICAGFLVKASIVPFHFWLPDAHAVAPTPVCIMFSGVMVEAGLLGVAKVLGATLLHPLHPHLDALRGALVVVGTLSACVGAVMCFAQRHLKRLLAFSTVSHAGIMMVGVGALEPGALGGAALYVLGHALVKSALFLCAGILLHRFRTVDELELIGRGKDAPGTGLLFALGGLALAGLPPVANFLGDAQMDDALKHLHLHGVGFVLTGAALLTSAAVLRVAGRVFLGWGPRSEVTPDIGGLHTEAPETDATRTTPVTMWLPPLLLLALAFALPAFFKLREASAAFATRFLDTAGLAARVLDGAPMPPLQLHPPEPLVGALVRIGIACALAVAIALCALFRDRLPAAAHRLLKQVAEVYTPLRKLHSGHVADDVAWLAFGVSVLGGLFLALLH